MGRAPPAVAPTRGRSERLPEPAEMRSQAVREVEDLRRGAVVLLEAHDRRVREPTRETEQVVGRRAGERVDRLVVVAHDAEVVASAEPAVEQPRLQRVHVLELVDGEGVEPRAGRLGGLGVLVEQSGRRARACPRSRSAPSSACAARTPRRSGASAPAGSAARDALEIGQVPAAGRSSGSSPIRSRRRARGGGGTCAAAAGRSRARRSAAPCGRAPGGGARRCALSQA